MRALASASIVCTAPALPKLGSARSFRSCLIMACLTERGMPTPRVAHSAVTMMASSLSL